MLHCRIYSPKSLELVVKRKFLASLNLSHREEANAKSPIHCPLQTHIRFNRQMDRWTDRQMDRQTDRQMDRWTDRQTDRQTNRWTDTQTGKQQVNCWTTALKLLTTRHYETKSSKVTPSVFHSLGHSCD